MLDNKGWSDGAKPLTALFLNKNQM